MDKDAEDLKYEEPAPDTDSAFLQKIMNEGPYWEQYNDLRQIEWEPLAGKTYWIRLIVKERNPHRPDEPYARILSRRAYVILEHARRM